MTQLTPHDKRGEPVLDARGREQFKRELILAQEKHKAQVAQRAKNKRAKQTEKERQRNERRRETMMSHAPPVELGGVKINSGYWKKAVC